MVGVVGAMGNADRSCEGSCRGRDIKSVRGLARSKYKKGRESVMSRVKKVNGGVETQMHS
jgi:hypothetical protein